MNTSFSHQNLWFPGFLERMACCALPPNNMNDIIVMNDSDNSLEHHEDDIDNVVLDENTRQPLSHQLPQRSRLPQVSPNTTFLPSPTLSPSRRELDRWDPSCIGIPACCTPSYAGSTATTASIMSEEEYYTHNDPGSVDEIRSNATTQVVSHRQKNYRRNELLSASLASAERRLKQQLQEEEARAEALKARKLERIGLQQKR